MGCLASPERLDRYRSDSRVNDRLATPETEPDGDVRDAREHWGLMILEQDKVGP